MVTGKVDRNAGKEAADSAELPAAESILQKTAVTAFEEWQFVNIVQLQVVPAVKIRVAAPSAQVIPVIYAGQESAIAAVIDRMRPGISPLKSQPVTSPVPIVHLQRVVTRR